jgi:membrane protein DedA with SNARE-associated domain
MDAVIRAMEHFVSDYGYAAIFVLMTLESACIPVPSEVTMLVGGWYAATGQLDFFLVGAMGVLGNLAGSLLAYGVGRTLGREVLDRYGRYVLIKSHDLDRAEAWWERYGEATTFFSRMLPVLRTFISLPAGIAEMRLGKFTVFTLLGCIPWVYALTWLGTVVRNNWRNVLHYFDWPTFLIGGILLVAVLAWIVRRRRAARTETLG